MAESHPPRFDRLVWTGYGIFLAVLLIWQLLFFAFGLPVRECAFWQIAIIMSAAHIYYGIQALVPRGSRRHVDLVVNLTQFLAAIVLIAAHLKGLVDQSASLWLAAALAFGHPLVTDWQHLRGFFKTEVARFVPPACLLIDTTLGVIGVVLAL